MIDAADPRWWPMLTVALRLGALADEVMFVGGAVVGLLVTDPAAPPMRPTDDVDLVVPIATIFQYHQIAEKLRSLGFFEDAESRITCRWKVTDVSDPSTAITVDVMPSTDGVLGLRNKWFDVALRDPIVVPFTDGRTLRIISAPHFCATKLEAFSDRGGGDYEASKDIEDVISVVDGRPSLLDEATACTGEVRAYLGSTIATLLTTPAFCNALPGLLPGDEAGQARAPLVFERLAALGQLAANKAV